MSNLYRKPIIIHATSSIPLAIAASEKEGYTLNAESAKFKNGKMIAVYLEKEFSGFAIHLLQK